MKYLRKFRLFENLESKIDLKELEDILIDFKQMGLDPDIKAGSSIVIDWNLFNDDKTGGSKCLYSSEIDKYAKSRTNNSLTIEFSSREIISYNIEETEEAYEMIKSYLYDNYDLIPNYIYINFHWDYIYFENFESIKRYKLTYPQGHNGIILGESDKNIFKSHKLIFGFYEDPDSVFRGSEF